jgi:hypothetical protein
VGNKALFLFFVLALIAKFIKTNIMKRLNAL